MKFYIKKLKLHFKKPFRIAHGTRNETDTILVKATQDNITGWGEAALPPYFHEKPQHVMEFIRSISPGSIYSEKELFSVLDAIRHMPNNNAAKSAIEMAMLDWGGKFFKKNICELLHIHAKKEVKTSYTIPIGNVLDMAEAINKAADFSVLKIKLGSEFDEAIIAYLAKCRPKQSYFADINQGWKNKEEAIRKINMLHKAGALFVEQPLPANYDEEQYWLKQRSPLPIIADEAIHTSDDLIKAQQLYHGINIKLVKCGGMINALQMISRSADSQLITLIGCMSESTCAVSAAAYMATQTNYADLDGPLLIKNNPFKGLLYQGETILLPYGHGLGISYAGS
jgi:L-alanine-DL-glutamate epimerase-like enolase superfamily enzyme